MIFPTNQSKRTSDNAQTNEISRYKSQIKVQIVSEQASVVLMKAISALNPSKSLREMPENRGNIQKIYDSVRKELQDECHCA